MNDAQTIVALSSGSLPSGIAVIRISGLQCREVIKSIIARKPRQRMAHLTSLKFPDDPHPVDQAIVLWLPGPASFTGEDCLELHVHGGRAVVARLIDGLVAMDGIRLAQAGEFSKRAFFNGRLDLTEIEGLADLIAAETEAQRLQAYHQAHGNLRTLYNGWRKQLIHIRAMIEAELDFSEEEDVPEDIGQAGQVRLSALIDEIASHLDDQFAGEIIRDGYQIALMGKPNAGKSSLLNALARRDVAIVTEEAGTTRDILSVDMDIGGFAVRVSDTAGIRKAQNLIEKEGVNRAQSLAKSANLVIWLHDMNDDQKPARHAYDNEILLYSKDDGGALKPGTSISARTGFGVSALLKRIRQMIEQKTATRETNVISQIRYRDALTECLDELVHARMDTGIARELQAEALRRAGDSLGRITGVIGSEDLLDIIFSKFCIGK